MTLPPSDDREDDVRAALAVVAPRDRPVVALGGHAAVTGLGARAVLDPDDLAGVRDVPGRRVEPHLLGKRFVGGGGQHVGVAALIPVVGHSCGDTRLRVVVPLDQLLVEQHPVVGPGERLHLLDKGERALRIHHCAELVAGVLLELLEGGHAERHGALRGDVEPARVRLVEVYDHHDGADEVHEHDAREDPHPDRHVLHQVSSSTVPVPGLSTIIRQPATARTAMWSLGT